MVIYVNEAIQFNKNIMNNIDLLISEERLERMELLSSETDRNSFISAEILTSNLAKEIYHIDYPMINGRAGEKPYLINHKNISISRSYSDNLLTLSFDDNGEIGIDIEKIKPIQENTLNFFFHKKEIKFINEAANKEEAYAIIWTRKESYMKCLGTGLSINCKNIDTSPKTKKNNKKLYPIYDVNTKVKKLYINSYIYKGFVISVSSTKDIEFPQLTK